jgi:hypothetical protein
MPPAPWQPPYHGWHVDAIWGKEQEDVVLLPVEHILQAFAESDGGIADLAVRVRAFCVWLKEYDFVIWERAILAFEKELPDVCISDLKGPVQGLDGGVSWCSR